MKNNFKRRDFIKTSALITGGMFLGTNSITAKSYSNILGANDRINFAIAGVRSRGNAHRESIKACDNAVVTHICEVDQRYRGNDCDKDS